MRRAGRIIYNLATAVSLLLCLATVGVWVRSYWVSDSLSSYERPTAGSKVHRNTVQSSRGGLRLSHFQYLGYYWDSNYYSPFQYRSEPTNDYPVLQTTREGLWPLNYQQYGALGFEWVPRAKGYNSAGPDSAIFATSLTFPLYFPTLLFALLPAHYLLRVRRRRRIASRRALGCCVECGYDLQATPDRCPECGAIPAKGAS